MRADWATLNGRWEFEFDDQDAGSARALVRGHARVLEDHRRALHVSVEVERHRRHRAFTTWSGIAARSRSRAGWQGRRVLLNFGAVDYEATIWVNGETAGQHRGGHASFALDVTDRLKAGDNVVVGARLRSRDRHDHPAREAVLEAEVREHLLHADDRAVAAGVDRGGGHDAHRAVAHHARRGQVAGEHRGGPRSRGAADARDAARRRRSGCA